MEKLENWTQVRLSVKYTWFERRACFWPESHFTEVDSALKKDLYTGGCRLSRVVIQKSGLPRDERSSHQAETVGKSPANPHVWVSAPGARGAPVQDTVFHQRSSGRDYGWILNAVCYSVIQFRKYLAFLLKETGLIVHWRNGKTAYNSKVSKVSWTGYSIPEHFIQVIWNR